MRAEAVVEAELRSGRTALARLRSEPPIALRRTGEGTVHQVASGGGPVGGDELVLRVRVGPGAALVLRTVAASVVLPGPTGAPSRVVLDAEVGDGGSLAVLPEPQVVSAGADHEVHSHVRLGRGARLTWRDELVLGRHGERGGSLLHRLRVDRLGAPLLRTDLAVGPRWPDSEGPAGTGGARAVGTLVAIGPPPAPASGPPAAGDPAGARWAALELEGGGVVVTALGETAASVRAALAQPALVPM